jgi:DNA-binding IclR family transcriptional regulator
MSTKSGRGVQSIEVGGRLLEQLAQASEPLMLRELAEAAALTPGQAHAYLVSFRNLRLVEQDPDTGRYRLGPFALTLGLARLRRHDPLALIWAAVPAFAESLHLMVTLSIWTDTGPVILRVHEAPFQIYSNIRSGARYSLLQTATGRLFAALMPADVVTPLIALERADADRAGAGLPDAAGYGALLELIRREGCAWTEGSPVPDISAVAAPVFDLNEQMVAAITLIGRRGAVSTGADGLHRRALQHFAATLSMQLGYPVTPTDDRFPEPITAPR